jgi:cell division protein FtsI/penicillin-binding protein 2
VMAQIAAAAATGRPVPPSLVAGQQAPAGPEAETQRVRAYLNEVMRAVVTVPGATGRSLADLPGPVQGKTGTAEFGTEVPAKSHSWFAGTRGDLAFAVFVYAGENTPFTAVSRARILLQKLP